MDSFIGEKFYWDNGGVWTVLYDNGLTCNKKRYTMHCSLCSKDKMMWPEGSIFSAKGDVKRGRCSCECKWCVVWTERQNKLRVIRCCTERGLKFSGWFGDYSGKRTFLKLTDLGKCVSWVSTNLDNLITKKVKGFEGLNYGEPLAIKFYERLPEYQRTTLSNRPIFKRNSTWYTYCSVCREDEISKALGVSCTFEIKELHTGTPCRCNPYHYHTLLQKTYLGRVASEKRGHVFIGVNKNMIIWKCKTCNTVNSTYLRGIGVCSNCSVSSGFDASKEGTLYLVQWGGEEGVYIKFGITNRTVEERVKEQGKKAKLSPTILHTYSGSGVEVASYEKKCKALTKGLPSCDRDLLPDGFTEAFVVDETLLQELRLLISKSTLSENH